MISNDLAIRTFNIKQKGQVIIMGLFGKGKTAKNVEETGAVIDKLLDQAFSEIRHNMRFIGIEEVLKAHPDLSREEVFWVYTVQLAGSVISGFDNDLAVTLLVKQSRGKMDIDRAIDIWRRDILPVEVKSDLLRYNDKLPRIDIK